MKSTRKFALSCAAALMVTVAAPNVAFACDKRAKSEAAVAESGGCAKKAEARGVAGGAPVEHEPCTEAAKGAGCAKAKAVQVAGNGAVAGESPCAKGAAAPGAGCAKTKAAPAAKADGATVAKNEGR